MSRQTGAWPLFPLWIGAYRPAVQEAIADADERVVSKHRRPDCEAGG